MHVHDEILACCPPCWFGRLFLQVSSALCNAMQSTMPATTFSDAVVPQWWTFKTTFWLSSLFLVAGDVEEQEYCNLHPVLQGYETHQKWIFQETEPLTRTNVQVYLESPESQKSNISPCHSKQRSGWLLNPSRSILQAIKELTNMVA